MSGLLLQVQEDRLDECRLVQIGPAVGQCGNGGGDLCGGDAQAQRSEGGDQIVVLSLHGNGTLLHRFLLPFCVKKDRFAIQTQTAANHLGTLLNLFCVENGTIAARSLGSWEESTLLERVEPGLRNAEYLAQLFKGDKSTAWRSGQGRTPVVGLN